MFCFVSALDAAGTLPAFGCGQLGRSLIGLRPHRLSASTFGRQCQRVLEPSAGGRTFPMLRNSASGPAVFRAGFRPDSNRESFRAVFRPAGLPMLTCSRLESSRNPARTTDFWPGSIIAYVEIRAIESTDEPGFRTWIARKPQEARHGVFPLFCGLGGAQG